MNNSGCIVRVPGKLMIAGEYAVLEPGYKAVVVAVDRFITGKITPSLDGALILPQLGLYDVSWRAEDEGIIFSVQDEKLSFIKSAFNVAYEFLKDMDKGFLPFSLTISSDLNDPYTDKKYGLGSSAAIVTTVIYSILYYNGEYKDKIDLMKVFKLSAIAHLKTQGNGSGADIAAATFGGWLEYSSYSASWLMKKLEEGIKIKDLLEMPWPNLSVKKLTPPENLHLGVGWTKESVGTAPMIKKIQAFQKKSSLEYEEFLNESYKAVEKLIKAFTSKDEKKVLEALSNNRKALLKLSDSAGVNIETDKIKILCSVADTFGAGKSSGAGGGDCGIAFVDAKEKLLALRESWKKAGIEPLDLFVSQDGCVMYPV